MADVKISALPVATGVAATDVAPVVNGGITAKATAAQIVTAALNATPVSAAQGGTGLTALGTGVATFLGTPSPANLKAAVTDDTGSGALVFATSPTLVTPNIGAATATSITYSGNSSVATFGDTPVSNYWYCDPDRTDTYTENGSQARPYKDLQDAIDAANAAAPVDVSPQFVVLQGTYTGNVTLTKGHVFLVGENGSMHTPLVIQGTVTVQATGGTLIGNTFSISGVEIVGATGNKCIYMTGTAPQKLNLDSVWLTANGTGVGLYQDNTGTGSFSHGSNIKVSHNGTGDVYCFQIIHGYGNYSNVETSGATQVGAVSSGAQLYFTNSELDANGDIVVEAYGTGTISVTNCIVSNTAANSSGIWIHASGGTAVVFNSIFQIPTGTGKVILGDAGGTVAYSGINLYPGYNVGISTSLTLAPITQYAGINIAPISITTGLTVAVLNAALPAAVYGTGARAFVTDATTPTFGATVVGGGAVKVPVYSDGTNWKVG